MMEYPFHLKMTQAVIMAVMDKWKDGFYWLDDGTMYKLGRALVRDEFGIDRTKFRRPPIRVEHTSLVHQALAWDGNVKFGRKKFRDTVCSRFKDWKTTPIENRTDAEATKLARLYFAVMFSEYFFCKPFAVNEDYFHLLDNLENLKSYRWDKAIVKFLKDGLNSAKEKKELTKERADTPIPGCVFFLESFVVNKEISPMKVKKKDQQEANQLTDQQEENQQEEKDKEEANQLTDLALLGPFCHVPKDLGRKFVKTNILLEIIEKHKLEVIKEQNLEIREGFEEDSNVMDIQKQRSLETEKEQNLETKKPEIRNQGGNEGSKKPRNPKKLVHDNNDLAANSVYSERTRARKRAKSGVNQLPMASHAPEDVDDEGHDLLKSFLRRNNKKQKKENADEQNCAVYVTYFMKRIVRDYSFKMSQKEAIEPEEFDKKRIKVLVNCLKDAKVMQAAKEQIDAIPDSSVC